MISAVGLVVGLIVDIPPVAHVNAPAPVVAQQRVNALSVAQLKAAQSSVFPTSSVVADLLDDFAAQESQKDAAIQARKDALKQAQLEAEAKAQAAFEAAEAKKAAQAEKAEKAKAEQAAKAAEAKEKAAAAKAAAADAKTTKTSKAAPKSAASSKYGTVEKINKQADRIQQREESGDEKPNPFGF